MATSIVSIVDSSRPTPGVYQTLLDLTKNATTDISFFGWRYIRSNPYEGAISLEALAEKVSTLSDTHFDISETDRATAKALAGRITELFKISDEKLKQKWWFTRLLCSLRDVHFDFGATLSIQGRWDWHIPHFCLYTEKQWVAKFSEAPTDCPSTRNPNRWFSEK